MRQKRIFLCASWLTMIALIITACGIVGGNEPPLEPAYATPGAPVNAYPAPNPLNTPPAGAPGTVEELLGGPVTEIPPTPFPTFTSWPTPTRIPGPTATALPLSNVAEDASGFIMYMIRKDERLAAINVLMTDGSGNLMGLPMRLSPAEYKFNWGSEMYPSPNGSRVIFVDNMGGRTVFNPENGWSAPLLRENPEPFGLFFGWHPDNRQVLIRADDNYKEVGLWLVDVDTGAHVTLLSQFPAPKMQGGAISPDGLQIVYSLQLGETFPGELWMMNSDGSDPHLLFDQVAFSLIWSPNGQHIAFFGGGLMIMNSDGSNKRLLSQNAAGGYNFRPVWSPDSRYLAFVAFDGPNPLTDRELLSEGQDIDVFKGTAIHLVDIETGEERPLFTDGSTGVIDPTWSPDGAQIAFTSIRSGKSEIWAVNIDGTNLRQLTASEQPVRYPFWYAPGENLLP